jgi:hypothetical protein
MDAEQLVPMGVYEPTDDVAAPVAALSGESRIAGLRIRRGAESRRTATAARPRRSPRSAVEQLAGALERLQAAGVAGVSVVDEAVLQRERAQTGVVHVVGNRNLEVRVEVRS